MKSGHVLPESVSTASKHPRAWRGLWFSACISSLLPWLILHWAGVSYLAYRDDQQLHLLWLHQGQSYQHRFAPASGQFALSRGPQAGAAQRAEVVSKPTPTTAPPVTQLVWQGGHVELALFPLNGDKHLAQFEQIRQNQRTWSAQLDIWHLLSTVSLIIAAVLWLRLWRQIPRDTPAR